MRCVWMGMVCGVACGMSSGQVLLDNLGEPTSAVSVLGTSGVDMIWAAQSFSTPARFMLDSVETLVGEATDGGAGGPDYVVELREGTDASGPAIATLVMAVPTTGPVQEETLTPSSAVVLEPGRLYWIVMGTATTGSLGWAYALGNNSLGIGSFGNYAYSGDSGVTWGSENSDDPYQARIHVSGVPGCVADVDDGSGTGTPDGGVTIDDLIYYLGLFEAGDVGADVDDGSGTGTPDGGVTIDDLIYYLTRFELGC